MTSRADRRALRAPGLALVLALAAACESRDAVAADGTGAPSKTVATVRAARRAYDGAPPTIPHGAMGVACTSCHNERGIDVPGLGFAPPSPHEHTQGLSSVSRCEQCHVYRAVESTFAASDFQPLAQLLARGRRQYPGAPPVMPHGTLMRESCTACHTGPAAREEIRCSHPERARCTQCHAATLSDTEFQRL